MGTSTMATMASPSIDRFVRGRSTGVLGDARAARAMHAAIRTLVHGVAKPHTMVTTEPDGNAKMVKGETPIVGLALSPATELVDTLEELGIREDAESLVGVRLHDRATACDGSTAGCRGLCLVKSGRMGSCSTVADIRRDGMRMARVCRTLLLLADPDGMGAIVSRELESHARKAGGPIAFRPDVVSDLTWWDIWAWLADHACVAMVYGYSKITRKIRTAPAWYSVTRSATERHGVAEVGRMLAGGNVAVPVDCSVDDLDGVTSWHGLPAINGDVTDERWTDPTGVVVLLAAKRGNGNRAAMSETRVSLRSFVKPLR